MVFDRPQQLVAARASVESFFSQSWPNKELVVYNTTPHSLSLWWRPCRRLSEIRLRPRQPGQMLALCAENANGEWVVNWMADCWYRPDYLGTLMQNRSRTRLSALRSKHVYSLKDHKILVIDDDSLPCWCAYRHAPLNLESDTPVVDQFSDVFHVDASASLVVKFVREIA